MEPLSHSGAGWRFCACKIERLSKVSRPRVTQMAKKSKIQHNQRRQRLVDQYAERRAALKEMIRNPETDDDKRLEAVRKLDGLPRNSSKSRVRNRCRLTGRPRGYYRKFALSRVAIRDLGLLGQIAGLKKASW